MNLGPDSLGKSSDLGVSSVSRIHFGFGFIANLDPDPIIEYALSSLSRFRGSILPVDFFLIFARATLASADISCRPVCRSVCHNSVFY